MPRTARIAPGGVTYHVLNRSVGGANLFRTKKDHEAFQKCLIQSLASVPLRLLGYCVMPNHWHLLLWPLEDGQLARFMMRLTTRHVRRWLTAHEQVGSGHLYQGRYKSFPMQADEHLAIVDRYIARNPLRAGLVTRAERWAWSAIGQASLPAALQVPLSPVPLARREDWLEWVNTPQTAAEEEAVRHSIRQGRPYGSDNWLRRNRDLLGWREPRRPGRPRKRR